MVTVPLLSQEYRTLCSVIKFQDFSVFGFTNLILSFFLDGLLSNLTNCLGASFFSYTLVNIMVIE